MGKSFAAALRTELDIRGKKGVLSPVDVCQIRVLLGIGDELIHIQLDRLHSTLHGGDDVTLAGRSDTDAPFGSKTLVCDTRRASSVKVLEVAAKDENLIRSKRCDMIRRFGLMRINRSTRACI